VSKLLRSFFALAAMLLVLPSSGCDTSKEFRVVIPDFQSAQVQGVWLWRQAPTGGEFERSLEITLGEPFLQDGREVVEYTMRDPVMQWEVTFVAPVFRDDANPDSAEIQLYALLWASDGLFKASTFNQYGESELSQEEIQIAL
jgi:hypothetical protein